MVTLHSSTIMQNPKIFPDPDTFKPERFLEANGKYLSQRPMGFVPFGMGRRVCLGEKLALADMFLIIVNLLQQTSGYEITLPDGPETANLGPDVKNSAVYSACEYNVLLKPI